MPYATVTQHTAKLADDFARDWIARLFGADALAEIDAALPHYQRGKRAGRPKGTLKWFKAHTPGFAREVQSGVRPGTIRVELWTGTADRDRDLCFGVVVLGRTEGIDVPRLRAAGAALNEEA